ncbi:MAG: hypothetical protein KDD47_17155, partial [Acidobacteria bacterium]|nr:hypothetical protein [Acidobacteriota bacterium]
MTASKKVEFELRLGGDVVVQEAVLRVYRVTAADPERIEKRVVRGREVSLRLPKGKERVLYAVAEILKIRQGEHEAEVGERRVQLVGVFKRSSKKVVLSERVTVATAYCFSRFLKVEAGGRVILSDRHRAIRLAYGMRKNFVGTRGKVSRVIRSSPNGLETNSWPLFNFLANLVHYGLTSEEVYAAFTGLLESTSLFGALHHLALDPFVDPEAIYGLIGEKAQPFRPSLPELEPPATPV